MEIFPTDVTLYEALKNTVGRYSNRVALEQGETRIQYWRLIKEVDKAASMFIQLGVKPGDTVAIVNNGMPSTVLSIYALNKIGAKSSLIGINTPYFDFIKLVNRNNCKVAIMGNRELSQYHEHLKDTTIDKVILTLVRDYFDAKEVYKRSVIALIRRERAKFNKKNIPKSVSVLYWDKLIKSIATDADSEPDNYVVNPDDTAIYIHFGSAVTEQSTVEISSSALNRQVEYSSFLLDIYRTETPSRILSFVDKAYTFGLTLGIHVPLLTGQTICMNSASTLELPVNEIFYYKPEIIVGYPSIINGLIDVGEAEGNGMHFIKRILSGADSINVALQTKLNAYLSKYNMDIELYQLYGVTETLSVVAYNPPSLNNARAIGVPLPGMQIKVVDHNTMQNKPVGTPGEICVLTSAHISRYYEDEDSTGRLMRDYPDGRKWIFTGDIGHFDESGILYFDSSKRRCSEIKGTTVYPHIVEKDIENIYGVERCCVVICTGEDSLKTMIAVVVPIDEWLLDNDRLVALKNSIELECSMVFSDAMRPSDIEFRAYLPMSSIGKIDYEALAISVEENRRKIN